MTPGSNQYHGGLAVHVLISTREGVSLLMHLKTIGHYVVSSIHQPNFLFSAKETHTSYIVSRYLFVFHFGQLSLNFGCAPVKSKLHLVREIPLDSERVCNYGKLTTMRRDARSRDQIQQTLILNMSPCVYMFVHCIQLQQN